MATAAAYVETPCRSFTAGAAIAQFLRVKITSSKLAAAGVGDDDLGTLEKASFADGDVRAVRLVTAQGTRKMVAAGAITAFTVVYQAAGGKIDDSPLGRRVGIAMQSAAADGDIIEVLPCPDWSAFSNILTVAAGATLTLTAADHGKTILLDTAAGSVVTLPAPVVGLEYNFIVSVVPTSNFHQVKVAAATDFMAGSVNLLDVDANAQTAYHAAVASDDNIQLNGTTKGGQIGDTFTTKCITSTVWSVKGMLVCPAGSNVADPFSAAV